MPAVPALNIRSVIDDRPVGRYQVTVAALCALIVFVDGFDAQAMGYVAPALTAAMRISRAVLGPVISSGLVGMMAGAFVSGPLADRHGRRPVLIGCTLVFGAGSLLTATAQSVETLAAFRALTGLGMGGAMPNAIALTSEYMPRRRRGTAVTAMICGFSLGAAIGGFVAAAVIPRFGWQSVFIVGGAVPLVIGAAAFVWLPESIGFLLAPGRRDDRAAAILARLAPGLDPSAPRAWNDARGHGGGLAVAHLFAGRRAIGTVLIWIVYFMNLLNLYFLNSWLPTMISDAHFPVTTAIRLTALFQVGGIGGALVLGWLLDRRFSFWVLAGSSLWAAAAVILIGWSGTSPLLLAMTITAAGLGIIGGQNAGHALAAAYYPVAIRSTGVGWALGIGRIGSIAGPVLGGVLLARGTAIAQVFWVAAIPAGMAAAAAAGIAVAGRGDTE